MAGFIYNPILKAKIWNVIICGGEMNPYFSKGGNAHNILWQTVHKISYVILIKVFLIRHYQLCIWMHLKCSN